MLEVLAFVVLVWLGCEIMLCAMWLERVSFPDMIGMFA